MPCEITNGNCLDLIPTLSDRSVDLVFTSPPYAEQRKREYGGIPEADYPQWTVNWLDEIRPKLKELASVVIVIRPHLFDGQISDYVLRTRLAVREAGWIECEELLWIKPNSPPLGSVFRPRRAWESMLWFSRHRRPYCDTKANGQESSRLGFVGKKGESTYVHNLTHPEDWTDKHGKARGKDYVEAGTGECDKTPGNTHPAQFPTKIARWAINMLCPPGGLVVDPFVGSGSTAVACIETQRNFIGYELSEEYCRIAAVRLEAMKPLEIQTSCPNPTRNA